MMEQELGTKINRLFSILGPLFHEEFPITFTAMLGKPWPGSQPGSGISSVTAHLLLWMWLS